MRGSSRDIATLVVCVVLLASAASARYILRARLYNSNSLVGRNITLVALYDAGTVLLGVILVVWCLLTFASVPSQWIGRPDSGSSAQPLRGTVVR